MTAHTAITPASQAPSEAAPSGAGPAPISQLGPSQREQLDRALAAGLVERGSVFVLSLLPIREQSGQRWDLRKDQIWERVERTFSSSLPVEDVFLRADEVSIVVAIASCSAYEGQARCVALLREIMTHFLGRPGDESIRLSRVTGMAGGDLVGEPIDVHAPPDPRHCRPPASQGAAEPVPPHQWNPPLGGRSYAAPFTNMRGEAVEMRLHVVPVWCLRRGLISSYAIRRSYPHAPPQNDFDQEAADLQTILRMVELLNEYRQRGGVFALHVPIYFATAGSRRSRVSLLGRCAPVLQLMRQVIVLEIEHVDGGIPQGRLQEALSMFSPFARAVMAGIRAGEQLNTSIRECRFSGIAIEADPTQSTFPSLKYLLARSRRFTPNVVVHNVALTPVIENQLIALGASHVTAPVVGDPDKSTVEQQLR